MATCKKTVEEEIRGKLDKVLNSNRGDLTERIRNSTIVPILREKVVITRAEKQDFELNEVEDKKNDKLVDCLSKKRTDQFRTLLEILRSENVDLPDTASKLEKQFDEEIQRMAKECLEKIRAQKDRQEAIKKFFEVLRTRCALLPASATELRKQFDEEIEKTLEEVLKQGNTQEIVDIQDTLRCLDDDNLVAIADKWEAKIDEQLNERFDKLRNSEEESREGNKDSTTGRH